MKMEERTIASHQKVDVLNEVRNANLWMMLGCLLQVVV
jgi:hypothetical protein